MSVVFGVGIGGLATLSLNVAAECAYEYDYEYAELSIASVTIDGVEVTDLAAYSGTVAIRAEEEGLTLVVTDESGVEVASEGWE